MGDGGLVTLLPAAAPTLSLVGRPRLAPSRLLSPSLVERLALLLAPVAALAQVAALARCLSEGLSLLAGLPLGTAPTTIGRLLSRALSVDVLLAPLLLPPTARLGAALG